MLLAPSPINVAQKHGMSQVIAPMPRKAYFQQQVTNSMSS